MSGLASAALEARASILGRSCRPLYAYFGVAQSFAPILFLRRCRSTGSSEVGVDHFNIGDVRIQPRDFSVA